MTLDEYVKQLHLDVDDFKSEWILNALSDHETFPTDNSEAFWTEQFIAHIKVEG